jgi:hypothetical protein
LFISHRPNAVIKKSVILELSAFYYHFLVVLGIGHENISQVVFIGAKTSR